MSSWNQIETQWHLLTAQVKAKWLKLTDDDLKVIAGKRDALVNLLQERYGVRRADAEKHVNDWAAKLAPTSKGNGPVAKPVSADGAAKHAGAARPGKQASPGNGNGNAKQASPGNGNGNAKQATPGNGNAKQASQGNGNGNAKQASPGNGAVAPGAAVASEIEPDMDAVTTKHVAAPGTGSRPLPQAKPASKHV